MKALRCHRWMPFVDLPLEDIPPPALGAGQVRIAIHYAGVVEDVHVVRRIGGDDHLRAPEVPAAGVGAAIRAWRP